MEFKEFRAKTVEDAITAAALEFSVASSELETEIVDRGSTGFLGIGGRQAVIKARAKNDISRDTKEYLDNYAKGKNNFIVKHIENGGVSNARNMGIDISNSKYIAFVDADDSVEKSFLEEAYNTTEVIVVDGN